MPPLIPLISGHQGDNNLCYDQYTGIFVINEEVSRLYGEVMLTFRLRLLECNCFSRAYKQMWYIWSIYGFVSYSCANNACGWLVGVLRPFKTILHNTCTYTYHLSTNNCLWCSVSLGARNRKHMNVLQKFFPFHFSYRCDIYH